MATIRVSDGQAWHSGSITKATDKIYGVVKFATEDEVLNGVGEDKAVNATTINNVVENITDSIEELSDETVKLDGDQEINGVKTFNNNITAPNQLDYSRITNCITHIPQDIKLELNNGTLTLKAGSKVYVPNGTVENAYTTNRDISNTLTTDGTYFVILTSESNFYLASSENCLSGTIANRPTSLTTQTGLYFATDENKVFLSNTSGNAWYNGEFYSLPIAIVTVSNGAISYIDQIFNGFGYIGSTVFALPGVKGLIPNGRNADGSLKNIEAVTSTVLTTTATGNVMVAFRSNAIGVSGAYSFDEKNNINLNDKSFWNVVTVGFAKESSGKIISFKPKTTFQATDYNDFKNELKDYLPRSGGAMTGVITRNGLLGSAGVNDNYIALYGGSAGTEGSACLLLYGGENGNSPGRFLLRAKTPDGEYMDFVGKPEGTLSWKGNTVATTNNTVNLTGDQTVDGVKTFLKSTIFEVLESDSRITTKNKSITIGVKPNETIYSGFKGVDSGGNEYANCNCSYNTSGRVGCNFYVKRSDGGSVVDGSFGIYIDEGGTTPYTLCPTPPTNDNSTKIATTAWVNTKLGSATPVGTIIAYAANSAPDGYLICNGAAISRTTYANLFAKIGTLYGTGDGSTTFNLPQLADGRFIRGESNAGNKYSAGLPNITGTADVSQGSSRSYNATGAFHQTNNGNGGNWDTSASCKLNIDASRSSGIYGASTTVMPQSLSMRFYIKY